MKRPRPVHMFKADSMSANLCNTRPSSNDDWQRKDWCSSWKKKVTCKKCLAKLKKLGKL